MGFSFFFHEAFLSFLATQGFGWNPGNAVTHRQKSEQVMELTIMASLVFVSKDSKNRRKDGQR
jgi:hypothetical protein